MISAENQEQNEFYNFGDMFDKCVEGLRSEERHIEEHTRENLSYEPSVDPDNNNNTLTLLQYVPHVQEILAIKGEPVSEVIEHPNSEGFKKHIKFE